ncbi:tape measure protein [Pseudomonas sp. 273]|uniref:tape measure protein n=1 Tax=Pseudomonas sp. 273 TaxID=75692 RepID=UPI0023D8BDAD|nr:tape measure protein [Pseudomonas sp. 273]
MAGKDLELALRLRADMKDGQAAVEALAAAISDVGDKAGAANKDLQKVGATGAVDQAQAAIDKLGHSLDGVSDKAVEAGKDLQKVGTTGAIDQAQTAVDKLGQGLDSVGTHATEAARQIIQVGESADQQAARIKAMVAASLQQQSSQEAAAASTQRLNAAVAAGNSNWEANARAQTAAMNAYSNAERARLAQVAAEQRAAEAAAKAAAEEEQQTRALQKLLGQLDSTQRGLAQLDQQERQLAEHLRAGRLEADQYAASMEKIRARRDALSGVENQAKSANTAMTSLAATARRLQSLLVIGVGGYGVTSAARSVVNTNLQWQQALYTMEAATGSAAKARQELEYVREISERLGLELLNTSQAYAKLVAAAKESPELGKSIQSVFDGVASATTALHLTREQTNGILLALEQMVSKGKVQTQELVLQLGQRVPGAFGLAAKALGTNTEQLSKWLEKGMIPATEFLPRFGAALQEAYGPAAQQAASGLNAELNRLQNAFTDLKIQAGESGFIDSYTNAVRELQKTLKDPAVREGLNTLITALGKMAEVGAKALGGAVSVTKFLADEAAARINGPAGDDPVRLQDAIDRESSYMTRVQADLDKAYAENDQKRIARYEEALTKAQEQIQTWQNQLNANLNTAKPLELPASTVTAPAPATTPFTPTGGEDKAAARLAKQNEDWVKALEKEAATYGATKAARREYELEERNLTGSLKARAEAAWAMLDAAEKQKKADDQAKKDAKTLAQLNLDYLKASGQTVDAAGAEIEKKYGALRKRLEAAGNTEGAGLVSKLMGIEKAKAELEQLQQQVDRIFSEQSRQEQSIQTQEQTGLMSELGARQKLVDLHKATADQVEALLPKMKELAERTGDPQALERVKDLEAQLGTLRAAADQVTQALKTGLENGLQNALQGLATGTMDLKEAAIAFVQDIAKALADVASQTLAQMATEKLTSLFQDESSGTSLTVGAAAVSTSAAEMSAAGASLVTGAAAISTAAAALAAASGAGGSGGGTGGGLTTESIVSGVGAPTDVVNWPGADAATASADAISSASTQGAAAMGDAITSASSQGSSIFGSALSSIFGSGADMFSSIFSSLGGLFSGGGAGGGGSLFSSILGGAGAAAVAASTGGHVRGPGTETSDSIPAALSDYEFITRAAVVKQPGALGFLHEFNARGMSALYDWARRVRHATGGLAGVPAPAMPVPSLPGGQAADPAKNFSANVANNFRIQNFLDSDSLSRAVTSNPLFEKTIQNWISSNPRLLRTVVNDG